ncbi:MAG: hypothetical protein EBR01_02285 [Proteobacteria bacterium]|jgi:hypothetical protein|nr:hypothetical protein [Pseudomonadota bacterium]NBY20079.1 hypothetical protein [bacterium]
MGDNQKKPSNLIRKDIHTTLSDILDFGSDKMTLVAAPKTPESTNERLKKLVRQLQELNRRVDRLTEG